MMLNVLDLDFGHKFCLEWIRGMWANCPNVGSPVSLGLFEGENKSKYFQKSLPQLCM